MSVLIIILKRSRVCQYKLPKKTSTSYCSSTITIKISFGCV